MVPPTLNYHDSLQEEKQRKPFVIGLGLLLLVVTGAVSFSLMAKVLSDAPCNHWGFDVRYFWPLPLPSCLWEGFTWHLRAASTRLIVVVCLAAALFAAFLFLLDHFNLLVEYDLWLRRGMPDRWMWTVCRDGRVDDRR